MSSKSKSAKVSSAPRKRAVKPPVRRARPDAAAFEAWEPQIPDERDDEIDCQRIVHGDDSRSLPLYYDEYY